MISESQPSKKQTKKATTSKVSKYEQDDDYKSKTKKTAEIPKFNSNLMISRRRLGSKIGGGETSKLSMVSKVDDLFAKASFGRK